MKFKDMLKYYRTQKGWSQRDLAKQLGISPSAIGMYESGKREPDFDIEERIADLFNVDLNTLRGRDVEAPAPTLTPDKEELLANYDKLNDEGKQKVRDYASDLLDSGKYEKRKRKYHRIGKITFLL